MTSEEQIGSYLVQIQCQSWLLNLSKRFVTKLLVTANHVELLSKHMFMHSRLTGRQNIMYILTCPTSAA